MSHDNGPSDICSQCRFWLAYTSALFYRLVHSVALRSNSANAKADLKLHLVQKIKGHFHAACHIIHSSSKYQNHFWPDISDAVADVRDITAPWAEPLRALWQNKPLDFDAEMQFNEKCSRNKPRCCICALFVPFKVRVYDIHHPFP